MSSRPWISAALVLAMLALGGCENDFIEVCTPTSVEIIEVSTTAVSVQIRSGDRPLRGKEVALRVVHAGETLVDRLAEAGTDGSARIEFADEAPPGAEVTVRFPADDVYCEASTTGEIGTGR